MMSKVNICTSFDQNYWKYGTVMLFSLLKNTDLCNEINIYILTDFLSEEIKEQIKKALNDFHTGIYFCEYDIKFFKENFSNLKLAPYISPLTLYRLVIDKILPQSLDKVLYLDADMIVDSNIRDMYDIDLKDGTVIGACKEIYIDLSSYHLGAITLDNYFNAGLLLINLDTWRKQDYTSIIINFINTYGENLVVADQDVLNYIFHKKTYFIHPQWNTPTTIYSASNSQKSRYTEEEFSQTKNHPKIIHFFGSLKPWNWLTHHPLSYKYYNYLLLSGLSENIDFYKHIVHKIILFFLNSKMLRKIIRKIYLYKKGTIQDDPL